MKEFQIMILAGGKSSRMGTDKGLLFYQDKTFTGHIVDVAKKISKNILIITSNETYRKYAETVADIYPGMGPAGGIYTGLMNSRCEKNMVLSCDVPFIGLSLLNKLMENSGPEDALICRENDKIHPLTGIYDLKSAPYFLAAIKNRQLKMKSILDSMNTTYLDVSHEFKNQLRNINNMEEFKALSHENSH